MTSNCQTEEFGIKTFELKANHTLALIANSFFSVWSLNMNTSNPAILTSSQTKSSKLLSLKDFNFEIPQEQIAQTPCSQRSGSRLLVKEQNGSLLNHYVTDLPQILPANSLLIFNDTQVFPSRLIGQLETGGKVELFLLYSPIHAKGSLIPK